MKLSKLLKVTITTTGILTVVGLAAAYFGHKENVDSPLTKLYVLAFNGNNIDIDIDSRIDRDKLKIIDNFANVILSNGKVVGKISNEYGDTYFNFYYDKKLFAIAGHFKTNWWHTHSYKINLKPDTNQIHIKLAIEGPNKNYDAFVKYIRNKGESIENKSFGTDGKLIKELTEKENDCLQ